MKRIPLLLAAGILLAGLPALTAPGIGGAANAAELTIAVSGITSAEGRVYVALHRARENISFPDTEGAVAGAWRLAREGGFDISFSGLEPGRYAVSGFHDTDGDGELDANLLGIPTESFGFGNGASGLFGPASFEESSITLKQTATIRLPIGEPGPAVSADRKSDQ